MAPVVKQMSGEEEARFRAYLYGIGQRRAQGVREAEKVAMFLQGWRQQSPRTSETYHAALRVWREHQMAKEQQP